MAAVDAQTFGPAPTIQEIFFSISGTSPGPGLPLAGGFIYSCVAGASCPGAPQPTFTDAGGGTANANPITLSANGTPVNGSSPVGIFLNCAQTYKFVVQDANNVTVSVTDGVSCAGTGGGGGGSSTNFWTLSGSSITNNNGAGAGDVSVGGNFNVASNLVVGAQINLTDTEVSPKYAIIRAPNTMTSTTTWRWAPADAAGCLTSDGMGNLSFATCGSGGSGSPGGANTNVQYNNAGGFGGSGNFIWNNSAQVATITASSSSTQGLVVLTGFIQSDVGFLAENNVTPTTPLQFNSIQSPKGGLYGLSMTALNYTNLGNYNDGARVGTPPLTTGDSSNAGEFYWDCGGVACSGGTGSAKIFNGSAFVTLATGGATSPGGSNTDVQINSGGSFGGSANLTFAGQKLTVTAASSSSQGVQVLTGFIQSDAGFLASSGTCTLWNCVQAPGGGVYGLNLTALNYAQVGNYSGSLAGGPPITSGDTAHAGAISFSVAGNCFSGFNGTTWACITGGGGGGSPAGPTTAVQFNNGGVFGGSSNLEWTGTDFLISGTSSTQALWVRSGYTESANGFLATAATATNYNAIQAPGGGVAAVSGSFVSYTNGGNSTGIPAPTTGDAFHAGAHYFDNGLGVERLCTLSTCSGGSGWVSMATGGIPSLNGLTGALTITPTANQTTVSASGSTIQIGAAQNIATTSTPTFAGIVSNGAFNANVFGSSIAFQTSGSTFSVDGNGNISATGSINMTGTNPYKISGTAVFDSSRNLVNIGSINMTGFLISSSLISTTSSIAATGQVGATGGFISGGNVGVSCSGAPSGSFQVTLGIVVHC